MLVHHGLFWNFHPTGLTPLLAERLRPLFKHDINLAAYHLPLDAHPELGNNAILARELGCEDRQPFGALQGHADRLPRPLRRASRPDELHARVRAATGREPLLLGAGPERIRSIGIVSGSAADTLHEAAAAGLDAFLTGEPREHITADAAELGMSVRGRRALRDGDVRRPRARRSAGRALRDRAHVRGPGQPGLADCLVEIEPVDVVDIR